MKPARVFSLVLVTAPDLRVARKLAGNILEKRLAACANLVPRLESHYWWHGKLEKSTEVLLLFKTRSALLGKLESAILALHPYDTPEIVAIPLGAGTPRYLAWLAESTSA